MNKATSSLRFFMLMIIVFAFLVPQKSWSQTLITNVGSTHIIQDFNSLPSSSAFTWVDNSSLLGWYVKTDKTLSTVFPSVKPNTGSNYLTAGLYSFGSSSSSDRALGYVPTDAFTGVSGTGKGYIGWRLKNNTAKSIGSIRIVWTGEEWRKATDANFQTINLSYQIGSQVTDLTAGTYTLTSSSFKSPVYDATNPVVLDGNATGNRTTQTLDMDCDIPAGSEIMFRWEDINDPANHTLAIDDIDFIATRESQTITFNQPDVKTYGDAAFNLDGTSTSGLDVSYTSSNTSVATINGNLVTITGAGTTTITASQPGDNSFAPAVNVVRVLTVKPQAPVAYAATGISPLQFTANWSTAMGSSGYYLYYSTSATFDTYSVASIGNILSFALTDLNPGTTYYYRLKSINSGIYSDYSNIISVHTDNPIQTNHIISSPTFTTATLNWTNGNLTSRVVFVKEGTGAITVPEDGNRYYESTDWASKGDSLSKSGYFCVYYGTGSSVTLTNLYPGRTYTVQAFEFYGGEWGETYLTTVSGVNNPVTFVPWPSTTFTNTSGISSPENWNTAVRWDHGIVPTSSLHPAVLVYIDGNCQITNTADCNNLTINAAHSGKTPKLSINAAQSLNVVGSLINNGNSASLIIRSNSSSPNGTLTYGTGSPVATVEMYSIAKFASNTANNIYKWQFFGIPVKTLNYDDSFSDCYVRQWDETVNDYNLLWIQQNNGNSLTLGSGSVLSSTKGYELCQPSPKTYSFSGVLENGDISIDLPYTTGAVYPGQHIIGNPYTAAIDISEMTFGANTESSVYLYNTGTYNDWYNSNGEITPGNGPGTYSVSTPGTAGSNGVPGQIPSMQAFLVKSTGGTGSINLSYKKLVTPNSEQQRVKKADNSTNLPVSTRIDVIGTHFSDRMWIFTNSSCTRHFDNGFDGRKMLGSSQVTQLYSSETDGIYQINAVNDMNESYLGFQPGDDSSFKMVFNHENVENKYAGIYLVDLLENKTTDITTNGSEYDFTATPGSAASQRFKIVTRPIETISGNEASSQLKMFSTDGAVFVQNMSQNIGTFVLYDLAGKAVQQAVISSNGITTIPTSGLTVGVYVAKATTDHEKITQRLIIR